MFEIKHLSKNFGGLEILKDVSLTVRKGSISALIGPNGAGKTTVFNCITGLVKPNLGSIQLEGQELIGQASHQVTRLGVARTFQNIRIFKEMSLLENVLVGMHSHLDYHSKDWLFTSSSYQEKEKQAKDRAYELLSLFELHHKHAQTAQSLSYGEQRQLEFARALATKPKILLLDEPVAGMNAAEKQGLMKEIEIIRQRGVTIFLIEHDMRFVMELCDHITVLNFGQVIAEGTPELIKNHPGVIEAYLGAVEE
jgi:branched-chain amino acid transport system ATP-binding protein